MPHLQDFLIRGGRSLEGKRFAQKRHFENRWEPNKAIKAQYPATGAKWKVIMTLLYMYIKRLGQKS